MIKFLFKMILILVLLVVATIIGAYFYAGEIVKKAVETYVPQVTGTSAKLDGMDLSLFKGEVSLNGLTIGNVKGYNSPDVFSVKKIYVKFDPKTVLEDKIIINQILIDGTHVSAEATYKDGNVTSNLTTIKNNVDKFMKQSSTKATTQKAEVKKEEKPAKSTSSKAVVIKDLQINNSSITVGLLSQSMDVPLPNIQQKNIGEKGKKTTLKDIIVMVFDMISVESIKATGKSAQELLKKSAEEALKGATSIVNDAKKNTEGLIKSVKDIV